LTDRVLSSAMGPANFAVSPTGTLVYIPATALTTTAGTQRSLVWVDRQGRETPTGLAPRAYADPRLSPDGTRVAVGIRGERNDIWIGTFSRGTLTRLSVDPSLDQAPVWTPDGSRIVWTSQADTGVPSLYVQSADGAGRPVRIFGTRNPVFSTSITPDGEKIVCWSNTADNAQDVFAIAMRPSGDSPLEPTPLLHSRAAEMDAEVSPDGRWLAYQSKESGDLQIYVAGSTGLGLDLRGYDVSPDGKRFLFVKEPAPDPAETQRETGIVVVADWTRELNGRGARR
jgi:serine/threonine-protein kinase